MVSCYLSYLCVHSAPSESAVIPPNHLWMSNHLCVHSALLRSPDLAEILLLEQQAEVVQAVVQHVVVDAHTHVQGT